MIALYGQGVDKITIFDQISANPRLQEVSKAICLGKHEDINMVIGFGGGSAMDAAKAVAVGIGSKVTIEDYFYKGISPTDTTLPIIAIPTTAGTGSELSKAAILTDETRKVKSGIRGENLYPTIAIVDASLTKNVPFQVTMETGFDVLAHAMERYISLSANPSTKMQSEYVIKSVGINLIKLTKNLEDLRAREEMSLASMMMGINLGNASTAHYLIACNIL